MKLLGSLPAKLASIRMLLIVLVGVFFGTGTVIVSSFSVFMLPMLKTFNMNRTEISLVVTIFLWSGAVIGPFLAKLIDRLTVRKVLVPSTILFGLTILALAFVGHSKWCLYFQFLLAGVAAPGMAGFAKILSLWYDQRRGLVLATLAVGAALSAAVMPGVTQILISSYSWQAAYISLGIMVILFALPAVAMMSEPKKLIREEHSQSSYKNGVSSSKALCSPTFWRITFGLGFVTMSIQGIQTHLIAILDNRGISSHVAIYLFPAIAIGTLLGQLTSGSLLDRFNSPRIILPLTLTSMAGMILFQSSNSIWGLIISCALLAFGAFGEIGTAPYFFTRYFGLGSFATIYAINFSFSIIFFGISPVISGVMYDLFGSYNMAMAFYMFLLFVSFLLIFFMRPYKYDLEGNRLNNYLVSSDAPSLLNETGENL